MKNPARTWRWALAGSVVAAGASAVLLTPAFSASPQASGPLGNCLAKNFHVSHGPVVPGFMPEGRKISTSIIFTNSGPACAIWGTPSIQAVSGSKHHAVGPIAHNLSMGEMGVRHIVKTNGTVSAKFTASVYFSLATCHVASADGIVVSLPDFVAATYVPLAMNVCAGVSSTTTQLITAGSAG